MNSHLASILAGNLTDLKEKLQASCSSSEWLQVLRYSSRRAFDCSKVSSELLCIVSTACDAVLAADQFDLVLFVKSLYYIVQVAAKQDDCPALLAVLPRVLTVVAKCYHQPDTHSFLKSLYQVTWNSSLRCQEHRVALKLQRFALTFLLVTAPDAINKVASLTDMAAANFSTKCAGTANNAQEGSSGDEAATKPVQDETVYFYHQILSSIFTHVNFTKKLEGSEVISITGLLTHCNIHQHASLLKYSLKTLQGFCSGPCYSAVYTGLQVLQTALRAEDDTAKLDAAMAALLPYKATICQDETARAVAVHCLLAALAALENSGASHEITYRLPVANLEPLMLTVLDFTSPDNTTQQTRLKVTANLYHFMKTLVIQLRSVSNQDKVTASSSSPTPGASDPSDQPSPSSLAAPSTAPSLPALCRTAARWSSLSKEKVPTLLPPPLTADNKFHYHNFGVCCGNLGVLCYRVSEFESASSCLKAFIVLQDSYVTAAPSEKQVVSGSVHKKRSLLCDALRYTGRYKEAAQTLADQTLRYAVEAATPGDAVPVEALVLQWFKLKRDALKDGNQDLQGALLSAAVHQLSSASLDPTPLLPQLLLQEYSAYAAASWECSAEQEQCGVLLLSLARDRLHLAPHNITATKHAVRSILMVAQVLYSSPERAVPDPFLVKNLLPSLKQTTVSGSCLTSADDKEEECCQHHPVAEDEGCPALHLLSTALTLCQRAVLPSVNNKETLCEDQEWGHQRLFAGEGCPADWREMVAELHFWLYLVLLQKYQLTKKQEEESNRSPCRSTSAAPVSLTAAATDLGEEQQPDDACDVRSNTAALLCNPPHQHALQHLDAALAAWTLAKDHPLDDAPNLCRLLNASGHVFRLHGHTHRTAQCWALLVRYAHQHHLHSYTLKGLVEQVWTCPELCSERLVSCITEQLNASRHDAQATLLAKVALALHHLTHGRVSLGWPVLQAVLRHELVVEKKTVRATEVQCLAHYVASHYSLLPASHAQCEGSGAPLNPVALAQIAAREAIALKHAVPDQPDLYSCERVTWLHQLTSAWLARLSLLTAQPRLARAYLKQPLMMAHQLALPYRAASVLSILAEVDLLCDQWDDCRVKVDTLLAVFSPFSQLTPREHRGRQQTAREKSPSNTITPKRLNLVDAEKKADAVSKKRAGAQVKAAGKENTFVSSLSKKVPKIRIEAIRHARSSNDSGGSSPNGFFGDEDTEDDGFLVRDAQNKLGAHKMVGIEASLKYLSLTSTHLDRNKLDKDRLFCPGSPSFDQREAATLMPRWNPQLTKALQPVDMNQRMDASPKKIPSKETHSGSQKHVPADLRPYCPGFSAVYLNTASMLSTLHRQGNRWQPASACIQTATEAYEQMQPEVSRLCTAISSIIDEHVPTSTASQAKKHSPHVARKPSVEEAAQLFTVNTFLVPWSGLQQTAVQLLAAREQWKEAARLAVSSVTTATTWPQSCLARHHSYLIPLLMQTKHLQCVLLLPTSNKGSSQLLHPRRVSPVASPRVPQPTTPEQSPSQHQAHCKPPTLRRTPLNFAHNVRNTAATSDHRRNAEGADISQDDSCDSFTSKDEPSNSSEGFTDSNSFNFDTSSSIGDVSSTKEKPSVVHDPTSSQLGDLDTKLKNMILSDTAEQPVSSSINLISAQINSKEDGATSKRLLSSKFRSKTYTGKDTKNNSSTSSTVRLKATATRTRTTVLSAESTSRRANDTSTTVANTSPPTSVRILPKKTILSKPVTIKKNTRTAKEGTQMESNSETNTPKVTPPKPLPKAIVKTSTRGRSSRTVASAAVKDAAPSQEQSTAEPPTASVRSSRLRSTRR